MSASINVHGNADLLRKSTKQPTLSFDRYFTCLPWEGFPNYVTRLLEILWAQQPIKFDGLIGGKFKHFLPSSNKFMAWNNRQIHTVNVRIGTWQLVICWMNLFYISSSKNNRVEGVIVFLWDRISLRLCIALLVKWRNNLRKTQCHSEHLTFNTTHLPSI